MKYDNWTAPEHRREASIMPRGIDRQLILDNRPNVMKHASKKQQEIAEELRRSYNARLIQDNPELAYKRKHK